MNKWIHIFMMLLLGGSISAWAKTDFGGNLSLDLYYLFQNGTRVAYQVEGKKKEGRFNPVNSETAFHSPQMFNQLWFQYATAEEALSMYLQVRAGSVLKRYEDNTTNRPDHIFSFFYAWMKWQVTGKLSLKAGRQAQAFSILQPNQVVGSVDYHGLGANFGDIYGAEGLDGLRLDWSITDVFGFSFMVMDTDTDRSTDNNEVVIVMASGEGNVREQNLIPRLDVAFPIKTGQFEIHPSATWLRQSYAHNQTGTDDHFDIWGLSLGARARFGALVLGGEVNYGQNLGDGNYIGAGEFFHEKNAFGAAGSYTLKGINISEKTGNTLTQYSKILNTNSLAFWFDLGYEISWLQPHFLFGALKIDGEAAPADPNFIKGRRFPKRASQTMVGINIPVSLSSYFSIIPELMYYDWGGGMISNALFKNHNGFESGVVQSSDINTADVKQNRGEEWIAGLQARFTF